MKNIELIYWKPDALRSETTLPMSPFVSGSDADTLSREACVGRGHIGAGVDVYMTFLHVRTLIIECQWSRLEKVKSCTAEVVFSALPVLF